MSLDVMIDIETASKRPDAAILSIGAVAFDPDALEIELSNPIRTLSLNVDLQSCLDIGLQVDGETIYWWLRQSDEARTALFAPHGPIHIASALYNLRRWLFFLERDPHPGYVLGGREPQFTGRVWAWPPSFDLTIIESARSRCLHPVVAHKFWQRRNERDARTLCVELGLHPVNDPAPKSGTEHVALNDAIGQASLVQRALRFGKIASVEYALSSVERVIPNTFEASPDWRDELWK